MRRHQLKTTTVLALGGLMGLPAAAMAEHAALIDVPEQPLATALDELSEETGLQVVVAEELTRGQRSRAVSGPMTAHQALAAMVDGTGLVLREVGQNSIAVTRRGLVTQGLTPGDEPIVLEPIVLVAEEARAGLFGDTPVKDIPFSVTAFTSDLIERTQARSIGELADNEASVQSQLSTSANNDFIRIRGFGAAFTIDGLNSLGARYNRPEFYEQIEFFKGPNALLNGVPIFGNIGGIANLVPKRATDNNINDLTLSYESDAHYVLSYDFGRKFGPNREFGIRVNAGIGDGPLAVDGAERQLSFASMALDFDNGGPFRANAFLSYQDVNNKRFQVGYRFASADIPIPDARDNTINENRFETASSTDLNAIFGVEYDILRNWTISARAAIRRSDDPANEGRSNVIINDDFDTTGTFFVGGTDLEAETYELQSQSRFTIGGVENDLVIQAVYTEQRTDSAFNSATEIDGITLDGNVFDPPTIPSSLRLSGASRVPSLEASSTSFGFSNRSTLLNGDLDIVFGLRYQRFEQTRFFATPTTTIDSDAVTGAFGIVYRFNEETNVYASYSEGLEPGRGSPSFAANRGEITEPITTEQYEVGAKYDNGRWGGSLAAFEITNPQAFVDANTNIFGLNGSTRSRGLEGSLFGEVIPGLRLTGSFLYSDTAQEETNAGVNEGKKAPGFPDFQATIYGEYDIAAVPGLTLKGRAIYQSETPVDADNSREIPSWARFDIGARYALDVVDVPLTLDLDIINVADEAYWRGTQFTEIYTGQPRTLLLTARYQF